MPSRSVRVGRLQVRWLSREEIESRRAWEALASSRSLDFPPEFTDWIQDYVRKRGV